MPTVSRLVHASPETVWHILVDLDAWPQWGPTVSRAELDGAGPLGLHSRGRIWTPVGVWLPFTVVEFDAGRCWRWEVAGIPATWHAVEPADGGCRVRFGAPWWATAYLPVCMIALERIARMAR
ncbi:polyketide cyclase [Mycobacterium sp. ACS1612]|uniref:SRPBCC family protein n=1 Tax=Mycobacterium sp. ACS1612 TaxID=1834117 RepID=UPI0007FEDC35|nr:SRPBCC family protein [Mycobacterium sp. ACS1612]OBF28398.1 polyketide cyclase [Mycobacterium sp. ACS1612]